MDKSYIPSKIHLVSHPADRIGRSRAAYHAGFYDQQRTDFQGSVRVPACSQWKSIWPDTAHDLCVLGLCVYGASSGHPLEYDDAVCGEDLQETLSRAPHSPARYWSLYRRLRNVCLCTQRLLRVYVFTNAVCFLRF